MVSSSHEAMHRVFQVDPGVFAHTFDRLGIPFRDPVAVTLRDEVRERVLGRADADLGKPVVQPCSPRTGGRGGRMSGTPNPPIPLSFFRSETSERLRDQGRAQAWRQCRALSTLTVLEVRGIEVSGVVRERIVTCEDPEQAERWFRRAITAGRAGGIFAED